MLRQWFSQDPTTFLVLNALAEDLRLLADVEGMQTIIGDLKNRARFEPTRHVVQSAALFARARKESVIRFFPQTSESLPDFEITIDGNTIAVEAKALLMSDIEQQVSRHAERLLQCIFAAALRPERQYPIVYIVIKSAHSLPSIDLVGHVTNAAISAWSGARITAHAKLFNVFLDPAPPEIESGYDYAVCNVLCPRSHKENLRVEGRSKVASNQLKSYTKGTRPGIFCLRVTDKQDSHFIAAQLQRRFAGNQNKALSGVILSRTGTHLTKPKRTVVNYLSAVINPNASVPLPNRVPLSPLGMTFDLLMASGPASEIPAYTYSRGRASLRRDGPAIYIPSVRHVTREMLF